MIICSCKKSSYNIEISGIFKKLLGGIHQKNKIRAFSVQIYPEKIQYNFQDQYVPSSCKVFDNVHRDKYSILFLRTSIMWFFTVMHFLQLFDCA